MVGEREWSLVFKDDAATHGLSTGHGISMTVTTKPQTRVSFDCAGGGSFSK